jgi:hydrogenase maturation protease
VGELAVICIGNRYAADDAVGCKVFDRLRAGSLAAEAADVDVIDGGLCGLDLLREIEGRRRVVFVDALAGIAAAGEIVVLDRDEAAAYAGAYGHAAGLPYLLSVLPDVCEAPLPEVALVGVEGAADEALLQALARRSLEVVRHGSR